MIKTPTINKVKFHNIGHRKALFYDLILRFYNKKKNKLIIGSNTYTLADNGVGKTSLISLILSVIRPYSYEFPRGEGNKKRELKDYIPSEGTSHILIEWILDSKKDARFLLTGMAIEKKDHEIKQFFYASQYSNEIKDDDFTLDNFPIFDEEENYLRIRDIRNILKKKKSTQKSGIDFTDKKGVWENFLKGNYIEPELYSIQAKMNQRESSQDTIMSFGNNIEFFERLVELIMPYEDSNELKENLRAVKNQFNEIKEIPTYNEKLLFSKKLRDIFSSGFILLEDKNKLINILNEKINHWDYLIRKINIILKNITNFQTQLNGVILHLEKQTDRIKLKLSYKKLLIKRLKLIILDLLLESLDKVLLELKDNKSKIEKERSLLENLSEYRKIQQVESRISELKLMIKETSSPLREKLEISKKEFALHCKNKVEYLKKEGENLNQEIKDDRIKRDDLRSTRDKNEISFTNIQKKIDEIDKFELDINKRILSLKTISLIKEGELPPIALDRIKREIDTQEVLIKENKEVFKNQSEKKQKLENQKIKLNAKYQTIKEKQNLSSFVLSEISETWRALTECKYFKREYDPFLIGSIEPVYSFLSNEDIANIKRIKNNLHSERVILNSEIRNKKDLVEFVENNGIFPPPSDINAIIALLKEKGMTASYGWKYLLENYNFADKEKVEFLAKNAPQFLEGIVIINPNKEKAYKFLSSQDIHTQFPLYIIDPTLFLEKIEESSFEDYFLVNNTIEWKYNSDKSLEYKDQLQEEVLNYIAKIEKINESMGLVEEFYELSNKFLIKYPEQFYKKIILEIKTRNQEITKIEEQIKNLEYKLEKKRAMVQKLDINIQNIEIKLKELNKDKDSLIVLKNDWDSFQNQIIHKQGFRKQIDEFHNEIRIIMDKLEEIENKINNVELKYKRLNSSLEKYLLELSNISLGPMFEKEYKKIVIDYPKHRIFLENFDNLKQLYIQAKEDFEADSTIDMHERELNKKRDERRKIRDKLNKRLKKRDLSLEILNNFSVSNQHLEEEDIDDRSLELDAIKEKLMRQIASIEQQIKLKKAEKDIIQEWFRDNDKDCSISYKPIIKIESLEVMKEYIESKILELGSKNKLIYESIEEKSEFNKKYEIFSQRIINLQAKINPNREILEKYIQKLINLQKEVEFHKEDLLNSDLMFLNNIISTGEEQSQSLIDFTINFVKKYEDNQEKIVNFVRKVNSESQLSEDSKLHGDPIVQFAANFNEDLISNLEMFIKNLDAKIMNFEQKISEHNEKLENIIKVYKMKTEAVLTKINELQRTRLKVFNSNLDKKQVFIINLDLKLSKNEDKEFIQKQIREYFLRIGRKEEFPKRLDSYNQLIKELVRECIKTRIKRIKFLVPRPGDLQPEYRELEETLKASGGETATVAILLYCLIAHFRMREIFSQNGMRGRKMIPTSSFIMDNPFGKANRNDLVKVQLSLANALNIQILAFSGHQDVNIIDQFDTVLPLRAYVDMDAQDTIVELDREDINYKIKGDSITRLHKPTIDSFIKKVEEN